MAAHAAGPGISPTPAIDLSELLVEVLPKNGLEGTNPRYLRHNRKLHRHGHEWWVRATAAGVIPMRIYPDRKELEWSIGLNPPDFGASAKISIQPGSYQKSPDGHYQYCWASNFTGCTFPVAAALSSPKLNSRLICPNHEGAELKYVYEVSAKGKKPSLLVYYESVGSGGSSNWLEIHSLSEQERLCRPLWP